MKDVDLFELLGASEPAPKEPSLPTLEAFLARKFSFRAGLRPADKYRPLKIDDWDGDVFQAFCFISVAVVEGEEVFLLEMTDPPCDDNVRETTAQIGENRHAWTTDERGHTKLFIRLEVKDGPFIRKLAKATRRVVNPRHVRRTGKPYNVPAWWWLAPRTARTLEALADALWEYRSLQAAARQRKRT